MTAPNKTKRFFAKVLFIDPDCHSHSEPREALASAAGSISENVEQYTEGEPTVGEWLREHAPDRKDLKSYLVGLFPFVSWIFHYNLTWMLGDVIAGVTVGFVVIPQGMAYALLAQLSPEYGLYTSFVGFLLYWAFATSKDITIGTVAVMSKLTGNVVIRVQDIHPEFDAPQIARALAVIAGAILLFIGLVRLGWVVEFIPLVAISSFMTGAALSITAGQVPALLGLTGVNTREATYAVIIDTLKALPTAKLDAATGLTALFALYSIRWFCGFMSKRHPSKQKLWFFLSSLRMTLVVLLYILISYLANRDIKDSKKAKFKILGDVPSGFQVKGVPDINTTLLGAIAPDLPATVIVLIIEHIAISKSFGRINNYVINPSQELVAVGFTNLLGPFLGAYPATGSFSRTAIKSKAGVRTPLAGLVTAAIVLLALYVLTSVFYYIPMSSLAALIIHAVGDLISPPQTVYQFWRLSPLEVPIFFGGVLITIFTTIENGIYFTIAASAALLLYRMSRTPGHFLGRVKVHRVARGDTGEKLELTSSGTETPAREAYLPLDRGDGSNPRISVNSPHPGVFVYRFGEGLNYTNQAFYMDKLVEHIFTETRRTELGNYAKLGDRPWNDPGPRRGAQPNQDDENKPILRAIILDFSTVNNLDVTSVQGLLDVRNQLDRYATPALVQWHFGGVHNRWAKRALAVAGFGYPSALQTEYLGRWKPVFSVAPTDAFDEVERTATETGRRDEEQGAEKVEVAAGDASVAETKTGRYAPIHGMNRPFFHIDLQAAVDSALLNI